MSKINPPEEQEKCEHIFYAVREEFLDTFAVVTKYTQPYAECIKCGFIPDLTEPKIVNE